MYCRNKWQVRIGFSFLFLGGFGEGVEWLLHIYISIFGRLILLYAGSKGLRTLYVNSSGKRDVCAQGGLRCNQL